jgi:hypothetical protein
VEVKSEKKSFLKTFSQNFATDSDWWVALRSRWFSTNGSVARWYHSAKVLTLFAGTIQGILNGEVSQYR